MGEEVKAVVQPMHWGDAGPELEAELMRLLPRAARRLQVPALDRLRPELPRLDTGKLYKKLLRARYWPVGR